MGHGKTAATLAFLFAVLPADVRAQAVAASFDELARVLRVGDTIYVTDKAGVTTWGKVDRLSQSSLTVLVLWRDAERAATLISGERREFTEATVTAIATSDPSGAQRMPVYPPSWHRVDALPRHADVIVTLDTGERRPFRFDVLDGETLRLSTPSGDQEAIPVTRVRRILQRGVDDATGNGLVVGALAGAGTMLLVTAAMYAQCDAGCDAPAYSEMYPASMSFGAAIGAVAGWIIDRIHKGTDQVFPARASGARISIAPLVAPTRRGVAVSVSF